MVWVRALLIGMLLGFGGAGPALVQADNATVDITGSYDSVITTKRGKRRHVINLVQTGSEVTGTWEDETHTLIGVREGDVVTFQWFVERAGYDLDGRWTIVEDGARLEGYWERPDGNYRGKWILTRIQ